MGGLFYECSSLEELPDLSKWNTKNTIFMMAMFYGCRKLKSLPDISKWSTDNVINITLLFFNCYSLKTLPDISKWNIYNPNIKLNVLFLMQKFKAYLEDLKLFNELLNSFNIVYDDKKEFLNLPDIKVGTPDIKSLQEIKNFFFFFVYKSLIGLFG